MTTTNTKKYVAVTSGIMAAVLAAVLAFTLMIPATAIAANSKQQQKAEATDTENTPEVPVTLTATYVAKYADCKLLVKVWPYITGANSGTQRVDTYDNEEAYPNQEVDHLACDGNWPINTDTSYVGNGEKIIGNFRVYPAHLDNANHADETARYWEHFDNVTVTFDVDTKYAYHSCRVYIEHEYETDSTGAKATQCLSTYINGEGQIRLLIDKDGEVHDGGVCSVNGLTYFTIVANDTADIDPNIDANLSPTSPQTGSNMPNMIIAAVLVLSVAVFTFTCNRKRQF